MNPPLDLRSLSLALAAVIVMAFLSTSFERELSWDEAVYYSQVRSDVPDAGWHPTRSPGILFLAAPCGAGQCGIETLRAFLFSLHTALFVAFLAVWQRVLRSAVGLVVVLAGFHWLIVYYLAELSNNLPFALLVLTSAGALSLHLQNRRESALAWYAVTLACAVALRIVEGFVVFVTIMGLLALWRSWRALFLTVIAAAIGALPYVVESFLYFGDPFSRMLEVSPDAKQIDGQLALAVRFAQALDGPTFPASRDSFGWVSATNAAVFFTAFVFSSAAVISRGRQNHEVLLYALGLTNLLMYVFVFRFPVPRYLIFSYLAFLTCGARLAWMLLAKLPFRAWRTPAVASIAAVFIGLNLIPTRDLQAKRLPNAAGLLERIGPIPGEALVVSEYGAPIYQFHLKRRVTRLNRERLKTCKYNKSSIIVIHARPIEPDDLCPDFRIVVRHGWSRGVGIAVLKRDSEG